MKSYAIVAIVLVGAVVLALTYSQFSYTKESEVAKIAPPEISASETETVNLPSWAGIGTMIVGGAILVFATVKP